MKDPELCMLKNHLSILIRRGKHVAWDDFYEESAEYYHKAKQRRRRPEEESVLAYDDYVGVMVAILCDMMDLEHIEITD